MNVAPGTRERARAICRELKSTPVTSKSAARRSATGTPQPQPRYRTRGPRPGRRRCTATTGRSYAEPSSANVSPRYASEIVS